MPQKLGYTDEINPPGAKKATGADVGKLRKRHKALLNERSSWLPDWRVLAEHFHPRRFRALDEEGTSETNEPGMSSKLVSNESVRAMRVLAAGMQGGMTSPARPWFRLGVPNPKLENSSVVKEWLAEVQRIILNVMARSNFYDSIHQIYSEVGTFGSGCIFALEDHENVVRYRTLTAGEFCLIAGADGRIIGVYRMIDLTAEQMVHKFGKKNCSSAVQTAYEDDGSKDKWFQIVHAVMPNPKRDPLKIDGSGKAYESFYYEYAKDSAQASANLLAYGGYEEQPFAGPRWDIIGSDIYGRGPGMDTLNDVKMLQSMQSTLLKAMHKQADPPVVAPSEMYDVNTIPGGINYIDTAKNEQLRPLYQVKADVVGAAAMIAQVKEDIREGLYNDLFKMLALSDRNNMTAHEVKQRVEEKLIMLGPVIERLHSELLDVLIDRTFEICLRRGILPLPPEELQGVELKVEYISLLAQAQKAIGTNSIDSFMLLIGSYAELFPDMLDIPDIDEVGDRYAEMLGVDPKLVRGRDEREERREAKAEAAAQAEKMEQAQAASGMLKDMGSVPPEVLEGEGPAGGLVQ